MSKEKILSVLFNVEPKVRQRILYAKDKNIIVKAKDDLGRMTLWEEKILFPFKLDNDLIVTVETTERTFSFNILEGYVWDGATIPKALYGLIGSREDIRFLVASLCHDVLLEEKLSIYYDTLKAEMSIKEYRRLTSLIFRELIKNYGTGTVKANIMSWVVQTFQATLNRRQWKI